MKKISVRRILLFFALSVCLVFLLWAYLASNTGDRYVNGIYVSELLRISSNRKYTANYCGAPAAMMEWQKEHGVTLSVWNRLTEEERQGKFPIGVLFERNDVTEYSLDRKSVV